MDEKIKGLWSKNKLFFFLLLPLSALWFARNLIIDLLVSSGNKLVGDATEESNKLKSEQDIANAKADQIKADADAAAAADKAEPVGEDWNKK
jgi:hypothetical protein